MDHGAIIDRVTRWAVRDENIRAVVLTGSVARGDHDGLSDLDLELYLRDPSDLLERTDWYQQFGKLLAVEALPNPASLPTRLLYLVDAKIDFAIGDLASLGAGGYSRPFRVLVDKDDRALELEYGELVPTPPSPEDFEECVNWFSAAALMQAKLILRNEPWLAKYRDRDLKVQLLRMITWDHRCRHGAQSETWYHGKRITNWADGDVLAELNDCWAGFVPESTIPALRASRRLFQRLAERTAHALDLPSFDHDAVHQEIERILAL